MKNSITKPVYAITLSLVLVAIMSQLSNAQSWNVTGNSTTAPNNIIGTTNATDLDIRTNNTSRLFVKGSNGFIGIGTATPGFLLDIVNTGNASMSFKSTTGNANILIERGNAANSASVNYRTAGAASWQTGNINNNDFTINNVGTGASMTILKANNNIGIGTATPASKLHVQGEVRCSNPGNGFVHTDGTTTLMTYLDAAGAWIGTESNHKLNFYTNNSAGPMMTISTSGAVGIGTAAPTTAKLVIAGATGTQGIDLSTSDQYANMRVLQNTNGTTDKDMYFGFQSGPTSSLHLYSNNAETMTVANGKVGIGAATATGYLLTVGGKIICTELKVQVQPFPDYVFANGYNLKSIDEVEQHIKTYNRLPGMPSACEVEQNGMNVGDMQTRVVEKVEENTLYIIQLKKEIDALKAELNTLKK